MGEKKLICVDFLVLRDRLPFPNCQLLLLFIMCCLCPCWECFPMPLRHYRTLGVHQPQYWIDHVSTCLNSLILYVVNAFAHGMDSLGLNNIHALINSDLISPLCTAEYNLPLTMNDNRTLTTSPQFFIWPKFSQSRWMSAGSLRLFGNRSSMCDHRLSHSMRESASGFS